MSDIQRICPQCDQSTGLEGLHCAHCGYHFEEGDLSKSADSGLMVSQSTLAKAALPLVAGAVGLIMRSGWKLLNARMAADPTAAALHRKGALKSASKKGRIHIRSRWTIRDDSGRWQEGASEHEIDIE